MKIAVYSIAKDEAKNVERFAESVRGADLVIVCDTGSQDETPRLLRQKGIEVYDIRVSPWRFDLARNLALMHVPEDVDVCIALDLDEILVPGWRKIIEEAWEPGTTMLRYPLVHRWDENGPVLSVWGFRVHSRHGYVWEYPIHEVLVWTRNPAEERVITIDKELIRHYPDLDKDRASRIKIFEQWMNDYKNDLRMVFLYARELFFHQRWREAEEWLRKYLEMTKPYPDPAEDLDAIAETRAKACRMLARCLFEQKKDINDVAVWMIRAVGEAPHIRDNWVRLAEFWLAVGDGAAAFAALRRAEQIDSRRYTSEIEEAAYNKTYLQQLATQAWSIFIAEELKRGEFVKEGKDGDL